MKPLASNIQNKAFKMAVEKFAPKTAKPMKARMQAAQVKRPKRVKT